MGPDGGVKLDHSAFSACPRSPREGPARAAAWGNQGGPFRAFEHVVGMGEPVLGPVGPVIRQLQRAIPNRYIWVKDGTIQPLQNSTIPLITASP